MRLFDTATQCAQDIPFDRPITIYVCGITPYASAHLGHALTYLTYDVLSRRIRQLGASVTMVRNITDIDDPLFERARETGEHWKALGDREVEAFHKDMTTLGLKEPEQEIRVTNEMPRIIHRIGELRDSGFTYANNGTLYCEIERVNGFGSVSHKDYESMLRLAAQRGGHVDDPHKRNPLDIALWRPSAPDEPRWETPWGTGRPGWHVQCVTIASDALGIPVHIHGGGADLEFPHHECEQAIGTMLGMDPFVEHWSHVALLSYEGEKMSKSLGNLVFVRDLVRTHSPGAVRLALLSHHYRMEWEWFDNEADIAERRLARWADSSKYAIDNSVRNEAARLLDDDLNTPEVIALLDDAASTSSVAPLAEEFLGIGS